jgi:hypothetical protein
VINVARQDSSRSTGIHRSTVSGVVQDWLDVRDLRGADVIRAQVALLVAAKLDTDVPAYGAIIPTEVESASPKARGAPSDYPSGPAKGRGRRLRSGRRAAPAAAEAIAMNSQGPS